MFVAVLAVAVAVASARDKSLGPAVRPAATHHSRPRSMLGNGGARPSPYWSLERKFVATLHREGRLGAEVRRLRRQVAVRRLQERLSAAGTIRLVFGPTYGDGAVRVATCESHLDPGAVNGQYVNVFQMGKHERETYGWHVAGSPVLVASLAAYRYFAATGYDWSPWDCRP